MKFALLLGLLCHLPLFGQVEQAWVNLIAKPNVEERLENGSLFLTDRALLRKQKFNIPLDQRDLPIENEFVNNLKSIENIEVLTASKWFNAVYVEGEQSAIEALVALDYVENVFFMNRNLNEPANTTTAAKTINESRFKEQLEFSYANTSIQTNQLNLQSLHNLGYTGADLLIGVMDSGFPNVDTMEAFTRARENEQILFTYDLEKDAALSFAATENNHGTLVLSTMLGYLENSFVGTAIDAHYCLFKTEVVASETPAEEAFWIAAAEKADSLGVDILNTSLGYSLFDDAKYNYVPNDMNGTTAYISQAANIAFEKGMIPVVSAGNSGNDPWNIITAPADAPGALSIGAVDENGAKASFSSVGPTPDGRIKPDVAALGLSAAVIAPDGTPGRVNGTSFSSPIMAGAVACLWQAFPNLSAQEIVTMIKQSGSTASDPNTAIGYGIPNLSALTNELEPLTLNLSADGEIKIANAAVSNTLSFFFPILNKEYTYRIFNINGQGMLQGKVSSNNPTVHTTNLPSGMYFIQIEEQKTFKFLK